VEHEGHVVLDQEAGQARDRDRVRVEVERQREIADLVDGEEGPVLPTTRASVSGSQVTPPSNSSEPWARS